MYYLIFERTGSARVFASLNLAQEWYGNKVRYYTGPKALMERFADYELLDLYTNLVSWHWDKVLHDGSPTQPGPIYSKKNRMFFPHPHNCGSLDKSELAKTILQFCDECAEHVGKPPRAEQKPGYTIDLKKAKQVMDAHEHGQLKVPKQVMGLVDALVDASFDFYTKEEMRSTCNTVAFLRRLKTKQDPWRIFRYYTPQLVELGVVTNTSE